MLTADLLARVESLLGARVTQQRAVSGGYTPAVRLVCQTTSGSVFVKAGVTPLTAQFVRREIAVYERIDEPFMPRLRAASAEGDVPVLIIEDLSDCTWPPPWDTRRVDSLIQQIREMHQRSTTLEPFEQVLGRFDSQWQSVANAPQPFLALGLATAHWLDRALPELIAAEALCSTAGDSLCHFDLRSDNLCFRGDTPILIDWNLACRGNPRLDLGFLLPSLAWEGGPKPETILPNAPEIAALVCGFFAARAGLPDIIDAPFVRRVQREQLSAALPWLCRSIGLALPDVSH